MKPNEPFTAFSDRILFDRRITPLDFTVYSVICQHAFGKKNFSNPSQDRIAFYCNKSTKHISRSIAKLIKFGYISKERVGKKLNNTYVISYFEKEDVDSVKKDFEKEYAVHFAGVLKNRPAFNRSDKTPVSGHSESDKTFSVDSDQTFLESDKTFLNSDQTKTILSDQTPRSQEAIQLKQKDFEAIQSQNLISGEISPEKRAAEKEPVHTISESSTAVGSDKLDTSEIGQVLDDLFSAPASVVQYEVPDVEPRKKRTPNQIMLEMFKEVYEEKIHSQYFVSDTAKTLKQCESIYLKISDLHEPKFSDTMRFAEFAYSLLEFAFDNQKEWTYKQIPTVGNLLLHFDTLANAYLVGVNQILRNSNQAEIIYKD